ncbi:MAG: carbohydrate kinase family protein [bacterium]|nr:carbohydrate kinase family protein [bacterium]
MYDVITFGGATRDVFFKTSKGVIFPDPEDEQEKMLAFKYGEKIITDNALFSFGGGAFNTAVSLAKMGLKASSCINIGRDESAHSIVQRLQEVGVDTCFVTTDAQNHTALSLIVMDKKDHLAFLHRGANNFLKLSDKEQIKNAKWFYITSLTGQSANILPELVNLAAENHIKIALNPGGAQLNGNCKQLRGLLDKVELLLLNREEAEELACSEEACEIIEDNNVLLHKVQKLGPKSVIITEGEKGSYYSGEGMVNFEPAFKKDGLVVDTTGAGDAFGSTFLACIIKVMKIPEAQKMAAINAAHVTQFIGAQDGLLTAEEIGDKLKEVKRV